MSVVRTHRAGSAIEDYCRACKTDRMHTVVAADPQGQPLRVLCVLLFNSSQYARQIPLQPQTGRPEFSPG